MWVIRIILLLVVFAIALGFAIYNAGLAPITELDVIWVSYRQVSVVMVVYWAFLTGAVVAAVFALTYIVKLHSTMRGERRLRRRLEAEVATLRNRTIEELDEL